MSDGGDNNNGNNNGNNNDQKNKKTTQITIIGEKGKINQKKKKTKQETILDDGAQRERTKEDSVGRTGTVSTQTTTKVRHAQIVVKHTRRTQPATTQ